MGTNYYLNRNVCPHCQRSEKRLHIGKSSAGWCFSLHVIPEEGLNSLEDWQAAWSVSDAVIADEYGSTLTPTDMTKIITERSRVGEPFTPKGLMRNLAEAGPNGLARSANDGSHCVGHGTGTWDLIAGEFS